MMEASPGDLERSEQDRMIEAGLKRIGRKILVMSGKGGVGKSTVAAAVALFLANRGFRVGLLDVDLHGPSIPRLLGIRGGLQMEEKGVVRPFAVNGNLSVMSMEMVLGENKDTAVIWRGPLKISAIRQFISDIEWGDLDFLVVDSPPGTGDEPLTVAQTIPDAEALIVTTPQEISLADVRKSIHFCRQVDLPILGLVENMTAMTCPHCGKEVSLFGSGGGASLAERMDLRLMGGIPADPGMVELGDRGALARLLEGPESEVRRAYDRIVDGILEGGSNTNPASSPA
ncbi:MAG: Mrp/NBP35 family ATP-binding protein [Deltaproteobacteria bacterium]|nr:Mrp/NBP35 family ATP-binding protein [Deltaproteobacteria bacterium]